MANPKKISLGVFAAGECPYPFEHTFNDANGNPINISGWTITVYIEGPDGPALGTGTPSITDGPNGATEYPWAENDFQSPGKYKMLLWVYDGASTRLASDLVTYEVYDGPGPTP